MKQSPSWAANDLQLGNKLPAHSETQGSQLRQQPPTLVTTMHSILSHPIRVNIILHLWLRFQPGISFQSLRLKFCTNLSYLSWCYTFCSSRPSWLNDHLLRTLPHNTVNTHHLHQPHGASLWMGKTLLQKWIIWVLNLPGRTWKLRNSRLSWHIRSIIIYGGKKKSAYSSMYHNWTYHYSHNVITMGY